MASSKNRRTQPKCQTIRGGAVESDANHGGDEARQQAGKGGTDEGAKAAQDTGRSVGAVAVFVRGQPHERRHHVDAEEGVAAGDNHHREDGPIVAEGVRHRFGQRQHRHARDGHEDADAHRDRQAEPTSQGAGGQAHHHVAQCAGCVKHTKKDHAVAQAQNVEGLQEGLDAEKADRHDSDDNQEHIDIVMEAGAVCPERQEFRHGSTVSAGKLNRFRSLCKTTILHQERVVEKPEIGLKDVPDWGAVEANLRADTLVFGAVCPVDARESALRSVLGNMGTIRLRYYALRRAEETAQVAVSLQSAWTCRAPG